MIINGLNFFVYLLGFFGFKLFGPYGPFIARYSNMPNNKVYSNGPSLISMKQNNGPAQYINHIDVVWSFETIHFISLLFVFRFILYL